MINYDIDVKYNVDPDYIKGSVNQIEFIKWIEECEYNILPPSRFYTMKRYCDEGYFYKPYPFTFGVENKDIATSFKKRWKGKLSKVKVKKEVDN